MRGVASDMIGVLLMGQGVEDWCNFDCEGNWYGNGWRWKTRRDAKFRVAHVMYSYFL